MDNPLLPSRLAGAIRREWRLRQLSDASYGFLFDPAPENEWVSLACATTGHDPDKDRILSLCAVRVCGQRVLSSERLEQDLAQGLPTAEAAEALLHFIGSRPLLGYYLEFDVAMLEQIVKPLIGIGLPQEQIDISSLYYDWRLRQLPPYQQDGVNIDLRYATLLQALELPQRESPDPLDRAVLTALAFIKLRQMAAA